MDEEKEKEAKKKSDSQRSKRWRNGALSLATKGPEDAMPDAGVDDGMAYLDGQPESGGVLACSDVMKSDFMHTIEETK